MSLTQSIIAEVLDARFEDIPQDTLDILKRACLDCIGVALFAYQNVDKPLADYAKLWGGLQESTLIGDGAKVPSYFAASVNSVMCEDTQFQETDPDMHDLPPIFMTALAVGEKTGASGGDILNITATVFEITCRLARNIKGPEDYLKFPRYIRRHLPLMTALCTGKLMGFSPQEMNQAMGIAWFGYLSPPLSETYGMVGGEEKYRVSPLFWATQCGIQSAFMAQITGTGPRDILDSRAAREIFNHEGIANSPPKFYAIEKELCLKRWISSFGKQGALELITKLMQENNIKVGEIEKVVFKGGKEYATAPTAGRKQTPENFWEARESTSWALANAICGLEAGNDWVSPNALKDQVRLGLASKIFVAAATHHENIIEITARGKTYSGCIASWDDFIGGPKRRLSWVDIESKFARLASTVIGGNKTKAILEICKSFENIRDLRELTKCFGN